MTREAHPIRAAERRQIVATAEGRGSSRGNNISTVGATDSLDSFAPTGLTCSNNTFHGLAGLLLNVGLSEIPLLSKEGRPRSGRGGYYRRAATAQIFAKRTALKSGGFAASKRKLCNFDNHPGADAPPLLEKEGNGVATLGNSPLRPWLRSFAAARLNKDAAIVAALFITSVYPNS